MISPQISRILWGSIASSLLPLLMLAQDAFDCNNDFYFTLGVENQPIDIYRMQIDNNNLPQFIPLNTAADQIDINAIGYRISDNFIYGINPGNYQLYRIDAAGNTTDLGTPTGASFDSEHYYAGDVTPDGRYLVVVGLRDGRSKSMIHIDLESPDYFATRTELSGVEIAVADLAFDPYTGWMYSFDARQNRLVIIDPATGVVQAPFPGQQPANMMGALFFDVFGQLWGYGRNPNEEEQRILFSLDKDTGEVVLVSEGPVSERNDGCACPYTLKVREWVDHDELVPCSEMNMVIEIANASALARNDLVLRHDFPEGVRIVEVQNPLIGDLVAGGVGTNYLEIRHLEVPLGVHQIKLRMEWLPDSEGTYQLQAELSNLPAALGGQTYSDNPATLQHEDPLEVVVRPLAIDFSSLENRICPEGSLWLEAGLQGVEYLWSDGSTDSGLEVSAAGWYSVTISSRCETFVESIEVLEWPLQVSLGPDRDVFLGDSLQLEAISWPPEVVVTQWEWNIPEQEIIECTVCPTQSLRPLFDGWYAVQISNEQGCMAQDTIQVRVEKDYQVYLPNVFSPNYDGINDWFYPQSRQAEEIQHWQIYDRWGNLIFQLANGTTNQPTLGWDGQSGLKATNHGTYLYLLEVHFLDGVIRQFSGSVSVMR